MNFENPSLTPEQEKRPQLEVKLHFNRHFEKGNLPEGESDDKYTPLSEEGIRNAKNQALSNIDLSRARAIGSSRERAQHTALFLMAGKHDGIVGDEQLDELEQKIREISGTEANVRINDRLNFEDAKDSPLGKMLDTAYQEKRYLEAIVKESDKIAREQGGEYESTYSYKAGQFAKIILHYIEAAERLAHQKDKEERIFERFLGTHQGLSESFLAKLIEVTDGIEARDIFVDEVGKEGFDYGEGFDVDIFQKDSKQVIQVIYTNKRTGKEFEKEISTDILQQIINQGIIK